MCEQCLMLFCVLVPLNNTDIQSRKDHCVLEKINNYANLNRLKPVPGRSIWREIWACGFFYKLPLNSWFDCEAVHSAHVGQGWSGDFWKGKRFMQIGCLLLGNITPERLLLLLSPVYAQKCCLSVCEQHPYYVIFSIWVAAEAPKHFTASTCQHIIFIMRFSAYFLVLGFCCGGSCLWNEFILQY